MKNQIENPYEFHKGFSFGLVSIYLSEFISKAYQLGEQGIWGISCGTSSFQLRSNG